MSAGVRTFSTFSGKVLKGGAVDQRQLVTGRRPMKLFKKSSESPSNQDSSIALRLCAITNRSRSQVAIYDGWSPPSGRP